MDSSDIISSASDIFSTVVDDETSSTKDVASGSVMERASDKYTLLECMKEDRVVGRCSTMSIGDNSSDVGLGAEACRT
jgi:hypothetical protein